MNDIIDDVLDFWARLARFLANVVLAMLDAIVARLGRSYDLDGERLEWATGRHAAGDLEPVPPDWSPLDDYELARILDGVYELCGATS